MELHRAEYAFSCKEAQGLRHKVRHNFKRLSNELAARNNGQK